MKIVGEDFEAQVSGAEAFDMQMKVTGLGFSLNIDKLYTNKIESVIREICSNARDSMLSAGRGNIPFHITLPSEISPYLIIKDTGTGMHEEDCINYLSVLYSSSKTNENQSVGSYGIGAKSPFAISDSYNIESIKDGIKYSFQFFRSSPRSLPQLLKLGEEYTDEPNGITFKIAVAELDREKYINALRTQLFNFTPKPIVDDDTWKFPDVKLLYEYGVIKVYESQIHRKYFGECCVEMGGVTYPLSSKEVDDTKFTNLLRGLRSHDIAVLSVPIGSIEVPGDRERIEYTDYTKSTLTKILNYEIGQLIDASKAKHLIDLAAAPSYREALAIQNKFYKNFEALIFKNKDNSTDINAMGDAKPYIFPLDPTQPDKHIPDINGYATRWEVGVNPNHDGRHQHRSLRFVKTTALLHEIDGPTLDGSLLRLKKYEHKPYYWTSNDLTVQNLNSRKNAGVKQWNDMAYMTENLMFKYNLHAEVQDKKLCIFILKDSDKHLTKHANYIMKKTVEEKFGNPEYWRVVCRYVKTFDDKDDFDEFKQVIQAFSKSDENFIFVRLSEIEIPKAAPAPRGISAEQQNIYGVRINIPESKYVGSQRNNSHSRYRKLDKDDKINSKGFLAYYDTDKKTGWLDPEMTIPYTSNIEESLYLMHQPVYFFSPQGIKKSMPGFKSLGCIELRDFVKPANIMKKFDKNARDMWAHLVLNRLAYENDYKPKEIAVTWDRLNRATWNHIQSAERMNMSASYRRFLERFAGTLVGDQQLRESAEIVWYMYSTDEPRYNDFLKKIELNVTDWFMNIIIPQRIEMMKLQLIGSSTNLALRIVSQLMFKTFKLDKKQISTTLADIRLDDLKAPKG